MNGVASALPRDNQDENASHPNCRAIVRAPLSEVNSEPPTRFSFAVASPQFGGERLVGLDRNPTDVSDVLHLGRRLYPPYLPKAGRSIDNLNAGKPLAKREVLDDRHPQRHLSSEFSAHPPKPARQAGERISQERSTIIAWARRRPTANVTHPGEGHFGRANLWDDGDRLTLKRHNNKPGPCRAFSKLGIEPREVANVGWGSNQQSV